MHLFYRDLGIVVVDAIGKAEDRIEVLYGAAIHKEKGPLLTRWIELWYDLHPPVVLDPSYLDNNVKGAFAVHGNRQVCYADRSIHGQVHYGYNSSTKVAALNLDTRECEDIFFQQQGAPSGSYQSKKGVSVGRISGMAIIKNDLYFSDAVGGVVCKVGLTPGGERVAASGKSDWCRVDVVAGKGQNQNVNYGTHTYQPPSHPLPRHCQKTDAKEDNGDGGPAKHAALRTPQALLASPDEKVLFILSQEGIRMVTLETSIIHTLQMKAPARSASGAQVGNNAEALLAPFTRDDFGSSPCSLVAVRNDLFAADSRGRVYGLHLVATDQDAADSPPFFVDAARVLVDLRSEWCAMPDHRNSQLFVSALSKGPCGSLLVGCRCAKGQEASNVVLAVWEDQRQPDTSTWNRIEVVVKVREYHLCPPEYRRGCSWISIQGITYFDNRREMIVCDSNRIWRMSHPVSSMTMPNPGGCQFEKNNSGWRVTEEGHKTTTISPAGPCRADTPSEKLPSSSAHTAPIAGAALTVQASHVVVTGTQAALAETSHAGTRLTTATCLAAAAAGPVQAVAAAQRGTAALASAAVGDSGAEADSEASPAAEEASHGLQVVASVSLPDLLPHQWAKFCMTFLGEALPEEFAIGVAPAKMIAQLVSGTPLNDDLLFSCAYRFAVESAMSMRWKVSRCGTKSLEQQEECTESRWYLFLRDRNQVTGIIRRQEEENGSCKYYIDAVVINGFALDLNVSVPLVVGASVPMKAPAFAPSAREDSKSPLRFSLEQPPPSKEKTLTCSSPRAEATLLSEVLFAASCLSILIPSSRPIVVTT